MNKKNRASLAVPPLPNPPICPANIAGCFQWIARPRLAFACASCFASACLQSGGMGKLVSFALLYPVLVSQVFSRRWAGQWHCCRPRRSCPGMVSSCIWLDPRAASRRLTGLLFCCTSLVMCFCHFCNNSNHGLLVFMASFLAYALLMSLPACLPCFRPVLVWH